jgi:hypothetical protein
MNSWINNTSTGFLNLNQTQESIKPAQESDLYSLTNQ